MLVDDPNQLEAIRNRESDITKDRILKILAVGTNVVLLTGGIDDIYMKVRNYIFLLIHINESVCINFFIIFV